MIYNHITVIDIDYCNMRFYHSPFGIRNFCRWAEYGHLVFFICPTRLRKYWIDDSWIPSFTSGLYILDVFVFYLFLNSFCSYDKFKSSNDLYISYIKAIHSRNRDGLVW